MSAAIKVGQVWERRQGRHRGMRLKVERFETTDGLGRDWWVARSLSSPHRRAYRADEFAEFDLVAGAGRSTEGEG